MRCRVAALLILPGMFSDRDLRGTIIDRIAVIVGTRVVKDSDIVRDIRVTGFLNREDPDFSLASRRRAASRLVDQEMIRTEIQSGGYPVVPESEAANLLAQTKKDRFATDAQYRSALAHDGITEPELKDRLLWQLTVLRFVDSRFRPMVVVSDEDIRNYYNSHRAALGSAKSVEDLKPQIQEQITGERINALFEEWLTQTRQGVRVAYREKSLE
jgi:hypothetical protein